MKSYFAALGAALVAGVVGLSAGSASALTCNAGGVSYALEPAINSSCQTGNVSGTSQVFFGETFTLGDKQPDDEGDGTVFFTDAPTANEASFPNGTWAVGLNISPLEQLEALVIVLKQANSFGAFLIPDGVLSGTWGTRGPGRSQMDLSHASAWYRTSPVPPPGPGVGVIPLPAPALLLLSGLAGMGLLGWRRRRTSADV